jgi:hypothetical protein
MGADTLIGNDAYNTANESSGTIKELMIDMSSKVPLISRPSRSPRAQLRRSRNTRPSSELKRR